MLGSIESIPRPGVLFQQKVIVQVIAKLEHLDDQERKRKRNVEQKKDQGRKDKEKETQEYEIQIKVKHVNGIRNSELDLNMLSATLTFAQTHHCDITETILCCWEVANPSKAKGEN